MKTQNKITLEHLGRELAEARKELSLYGDQPYAALGVVHIIDFLEEAIEYMSSENIQEIDSALLHTRVIEIREEKYGFKGE